MEFVIKIYDRPEAAALRDVHRKAHLDYLKRFDGVTRFAGPFLTDDGARELGSFRILDLADRAAAEEHDRVAATAATAAARSRSRCCPASPGVGPLRRVGEGPGCALLGRWGGRTLPSPTQRSR